MHEATAVKPLGRLNTHYLFTNIRGFLITALVLYHFSSGTINASRNLAFDRLSPITAILTGPMVMLFSVAVPLFVVVTGFYSKDTEACRNSAFSSVLVPYIFLSIVSTVFISIVTQTPLYVQIFDPVLQLWYLLCIFIWYLLLRDITRIKFVLPISIVLSLTVNLIINESAIYYWSGFGTFMSLSRAVSFLPYLLIGFYLTSTTLGRIREMKIWKIILLAVGLWAISSLIIYIFSTYDGLRTYSLLSLKGDLPYFEYFKPIEGYSGLNLRQSNIAGVILRLVFYPIVLGFGVLMIRLFPMKKCGILRKVGEASLTIFCLHSFLVMPLLYLLPDSNPWVYYSLAVICTLLIVYILSLNIVHKNYTKFIFWLGDVIFKKDKKSEGKVK